MKTKNVDLYALIENDKEEKIAKEMIKKHKRKKLKLMPYYASDGKTIFYCSSPERGEKAIKDFERNQKKYIGI